LVNIRGEGSKGFERQDRLFIEGTKLVHVDLAEEDSGLRYEKLPKEKE